MAQKKENGTAVEKKDTPAAENEKATAVEEKDPAAQKKKKVTKIPAKAEAKPDTPLQAKKKRVAGYARVSTDQEEQQSSYTTQVNYYTNYIKGHDDWEFAGLYADEGISATCLRHREGFKQMVADALAGKIDLILTKSVSRFARNTVDSLTTIRELKDHGVEVYFEKENIWTLDSKGELLITIMSSLAQEESRSISENTTWGLRKQFADGKASVCYSSFLGYDKDFKVNEEQAKTVRLIYALFLQGMSANAIAQELMRRKILSPTGKERWWASSVQNILTNEKYKGDALLQKEYTVDFLQKKMKKNEGEVPQYYVEGDHEAIIDPATFDFVQTEIERRRQMPGRSSKSVFSAKIKCGDCGSWYGAKTWHSNSKYKCVVYQCNRKYDGEKKCSTPNITEEEIKEIFVRAVNILLSEKDKLIESIQFILSAICDNSKLEKEQERLRKKLENGYSKELVDELGKVTQSIKANAARRIQVEHFLNGVLEYGPVEEFHEDMWISLVDHMTIYSEDDVRVTFRDGTEIGGGKIKKKKKSA